MALERAYRNRTLLRDAIHNNCEPGSYIRDDSAPDITTKHAQLLDAVKAADSVVTLQIDRLRQQLSIAEQTNVEYMLKLNLASIQTQNGNDPRTRTRYSNV